MLHYFIGLGSNIAPQANIVRMLEALRTIAPALAIGRVVETAPVAVAGDPFLNVPVALRCDLNPQELKARLNAIEAALGRDRGDPQSKTKSRPADLDILLWIDDKATAVPADLLPHEPYMRPMLLELLHFLRLPTDAETPELPAGVALAFAGVVVGGGPVVVGAWEIADSR